MREDKNTLTVKELSQCHQSTPIQKNSYTLKPQCLRSQGTKNQHIQTLLQFMEETRINGDLINTQITP